MDLIWKGNRLLTPGGGLHLSIVVPEPPTVPQVTIGTQTWMKYNISDNIAGSKVMNNNEANRSLYGGLYTWAMLTDILALYPGWHVPSTTEWTTLGVTVAGAITAASRELRATGTTYWESSIGPGLDTVGFTAVGGGFYNGTFQMFRYSASIWSSTEIDTLNAYYTELDFDSDNMYVTPSWETAKTQYKSVRLIKNQ